MQLVYRANVSIRQTAATGSGGVVWAMRAGARGVAIRRLCLSMGFDGTAAAATTVRYALRTFTTDNYTGGTDVVPQPRSLNHSASQLGFCRFVDTGLTAGGAVVLSPIFAELWLPISVTSTRARYDIDFGVRPEDYDGRILLRTARTTEQAGAGEAAKGADGFLIALSAAAVIGQTLSGYVEFEEHALV